MMNYKGNFGHMLNTHIMHSCGSGTAVCHSQAMSSRRFLVRELINQRLELEGGALTGLISWKAQEKTHKLI